MHIRFIIRPMYIKYDAIKNYGYFKIAVSPYIAYKKRSVIRHIMSH